MKFIRFLKTLTPLKLYPHAFPLEEQDDLGVVRTMPTFKKARGRSVWVEIQIIVRSIHPEVSERYALDLIEQLDRRTNYDIEDLHVILTRVNSPVPIYIGKDENDRYKYSINISFLVDRITS
jgi:hypothetical protein